MRILPLISVTLGCALAQTPDAATIMSRVGINQAKASDMRRQFVFDQKQLLRLHRGNGKLAREERREYVVTPVPRGIKKQLTRFEGKYETHNRFVSYDHPNYSYKNVDIDNFLIDAMADDDDSDSSRDGVSSDLFPLTYHQQLKYDFQLKGTETYRGRRVYRVTFEPKKGQEGDWKGEALIDVTEYQPVLVTTKMAYGVPAAVKVLLGTNIKGLGFTVSYEKFGDGVWFPVSYGGEFEIRAAFLYKRSASVSLVNTGFRRTDVTTGISYALDNQ